MPEPAVWWAAGRKSKHQVIPPKNGSGLAWSLHLTPLGLRPETPAWEVRLEINGPSQPQAGRFKGRKFSKPQGPSP